MSYAQQDVDVFLDAKKVAEAVARLGQQISRDYQGKEITVIAIMKGALPFAMDLIRQIDGPLSLEVLGVLLVPRY